MAVRPETVTITSGTAVSSTLTLQPNEIIAGFITPAAWTAADVGFQVSVDNSTFAHIVDPTRLAATSHARCVNIEASKYFAVPSVMDVNHGAHIRLTSINTASNANVNQGADRSIIVIIETTK